MDPALFRSATKQYVTDDQMRAICRRAFGSDPIEWSEAGEGQFNAAYYVTTGSGQKVVLKVAPATGTPVLRYERGIMRGEVEAMRLVASRTSLPLARVLYYDHSHDIVPGDWFFSNRIDGESFLTPETPITDEQRAHIRRGIGAMTRTINDIIGEGYGLFTWKDSLRPDWPAAFRDIIGGTLLDADDAGMDLGFDHSRVLDALDRDREIFLEVDKPRLVHWDIWSANVFVKNGEIVGLIDFERCIWGDPLLEVGFRGTFSGIDPEFLAGYGRGPLDAHEQRRAWWYDLYLLLNMAVEPAYRKYPDGGKQTRDCIAMINKMLDEGL